MKEEITLEVLNPRGLLMEQMLTAPTARLSDLNGRVVGFYDNGKPGVVNFYSVLEELLKKRFPEVKTRLIRGPFQISENLAKKFAQEVDTFVYAWGD